jgi:hypothetical protein
MNRSSQDERSIVTAVLSTVLYNCFYIYIYIYASWFFLSQILLTISSKHLWFYCTCVTCHYKQECFTCKGKFHWRCVRCTVASHNQCAPWSDEVVYLKNQPGRAVCWRHPTNWQLDKKVNLFFPSLAAHYYPFWNFGA